MQSSLFTLDWTSIKSALVSALLTTFIALAGYIIGIGDVFRIDVHALINVGALAGLTALISLLKSFLTNSQGDFVGKVNIK